MKKRRVLFIHQNFPGQFRAIAHHLNQQADTDVLAIGQAYAPKLAGVPMVTYAPARQAAVSTHHYLRATEQHVLNGQAVAKALLTLKQQGYAPDVVIAHTGWGEALFLKDVFPSTPVVGFFEFFYGAYGRDTGFDPEFPMQLDDIFRIRCKNTTQLLSLESVDIGISPTQWQRNTFPEAYRSKLVLLHEGIHTHVALPNANSTYTLPNGVVLDHAAEVITFVSRNLEPYRGFHVFMRALPSLLARCPNAQVVIVGGDDVSYGRKPTQFGCWREAMLAEIKLLTDVPLPMHRVHMVGKLPYEAYLRLLQVSSVHVYLTVPFVLSWSLMEAMSCECAIVASNTAPVREVITHEQEGLLVDFFDTSALVDSVVGLLHDPTRARQLGQAARAKVVQHYTVEQGLAGYEKVIDDVMKRLS